MRTLFHVKVSQAQTIGRAPLQATAPHVPKSCTELVHLLGQIETEDHPLCFCVLTVPRREHGLFSWKAHPVFTVKPTSGHPTLSSG